MARAAEECIAELKSRHCDFSLLFWLRTPETLTDTDIGDELGLFLTDMKLTIRHFYDREFKQGFFTKLREEFNRTGLDKINENHFVVEMNKGGKERAINAAAKSPWPRPYQPFCFQARLV